MGGWLFTSCSAQQEELGPPHDTPYDTPPIHVLLHLLYIKQTFDVIVYYELYRRIFYLLTTNQYRQNIKIDVGVIGVGGFST